ncbi:MAG: cupin domain-containing protein [Thermodesulfobacteriota bacterium]|nr:cupin domain-containing protein [Thermodesulfobacteriota bacterium]
MAHFKRIEPGTFGWQDDRGWGIRPFNAIDPSLKSSLNLHVVSMKPGSVRGNHCHTTGTEWLLVCGGPATIAWRKINEDESGETVVNGQEPAFFEIPPNVAHAVLNTSDEEIYLVAMDDAHEADTVRFSTLLEPIEKK